MWDIDTRSGEFEHIEPYVHIPTFDEGKSLGQAQEVVQEPI